MEQNHPSADLNVDAFIRDLGSFRRRRREQAERALRDMIPERLTELLEAIERERQTYLRILTGNTPLFLAYPVVLALDHFAERLHSVWTSLTLIILMFLVASVLAIFPRAAY